MSRPVRGAKLCRHLDLADIGLRQHAGVARSNRHAGQRDISEFFVLEGQFDPLDLHMCARAGQALGEMAPVRRSKRAFAVMRAGRRDTGAQGDRSLPQRQYSRIAGGRAGFDYQQRVAGLFPHQVGKRFLLGIADLADHVAGNHEIRGIGVGEQTAGLPRLVGHAAQARALAGEVQRQRAQGVVGVEQGRCCNDGNTSVAAQVAVPGPAPISSRLAGAKSGLISESAFRLATTAAYVAGIRASA